MAAGRGRWAVADVGPADAPEPEGARQLLRAFSDSPDGGFTVGQHLVLDAALVRVALVAFSPW